MASSVNLLLSVFGGISVELAKDSIGLGVNNRGLGSGILQIRISLISMTVGSAAILLFLIMDPFGNMVTFHSLLGNLDARRRVQVILRESIIAFLILLFFLVAGKWVLTFLGLATSTLSISGGILLFLIALGMVFPSKRILDSEAEQGGELLVVPLAIPMIAGPSAIAALLLMTSREPHKLGHWALALTIAWLLGTLILTASVPLFRFLGHRGAAAIERLMGMLLVMISVQMFLDGLKICLGD